MLLEGLHIPLTTPFHADGRLNLRKLAANILRYSLTPAAGLIVLGHSGEPTLLNDDETRDVLRTAAEAAAPEKVLIAGISRDSVRATLDLAAYAAEQNYDAILAGPPSILARSQATELAAFFRTVADRSPLPVILLSARVSSIAQNAIAELATHGNVIGLLTDDAASLTGLRSSTATIRHEATVTHVFAPVTRRMQQSASAGESLISAASLTTAVAEAPTKPALRTRTKSVGFQIVSTDTATMLEALDAGGVGVAPAFAAAAPQACYEVFAAWKDQDQPLASEKQQRLLEAARLVARLGPAALKFAADLNGYAGGLPRLPHLPLTGEQQAAIETAMKPLRN